MDASRAGTATGQALDVRRPVRAVVLAITLTAGLAGCLSPAAPAAPISSGEAGPPISPSAPPGSTCGS